MFCNDCETISFEPGGARKRDGRRLTTAGEERNVPLVCQLDFKLSLVA